MFEPNLNVDVCVPGEKLPEPGKKYLVQFKKYRCLAVVDKKGVWKAFHTGEQLPDFVRVVANV